MADPQTFHDAFLFGLHDAYDAERQIARTLASFTRAARRYEVHSALASRLDEARLHVARLERVFRLLDEPARGAHCEPVAAILEEGMDVLGEAADDEAIDGRLIAVVRRAGHHQSVSYATLVAWAAAMRLPEVSRLLRLMLEDEKGADQELALAGPASGLEDTRPFTPVAVAPKTTHR